MTAAGPDGASPGTDRPRDHHAVSAPGGVRRFDPAHWERLVSPERRRLMEPGAHLDAHVAPLLPGGLAGRVVADVGCGPGFLTLPLAERVGEPAGGGRVVAVDVAPAMLAVLADRLAAAGLTDRVEARLAVDPDALPIADGSVALALLAFVAHEVAEPVRLLRAIRRALAPGGRLVLLEWEPRDEPIGPPLDERRTMAAWETLVRAAGFGAVAGVPVNRSQHQVTGTA